MCIDADNRGHAVLRHSYQIQPASNNWLKVLLDVRRSEFCLPERRFLIEDSSGTWEL